MSRAHNPRNHPAPARARGRETAGQILGAAAVLTGEGGSGAVTTGAIAGRGDVVAAEPRS